jgi:uncharacterized protein (UPF0333 family)
MDSKTKKGLLVTGVVLAVGAVAYFVLVKKKTTSSIFKPNSREVIIKYLDATFGTSATHTTFINGATQSYVDSWANALMSGKSTFVDNGKTYNTAGGTSVK